MKAENTEEKDHDKPTEWYDSAVTRQIREPTIEQQEKSLGYQKHKKEWTEPKKKNERYRWLGFH